MICIITQIIISLNKRNKTKNEFISKKGGRSEKVTNNNFYFIYTSIKMLCSKCAM
jgi:hypothetical protein